MGISSALNAGVMGLSVNSTKLATISENIANSETNGYKRVDTEFTSMVLESSSGAFTAGGVRAATTRFIEDEGPLSSTSNSTDISVAGGGFLPVTTLNGLNSDGASRELQLVTSGSFRPDQEGNLVTPSGQYLLGWPFDADGNVIQGSQDSVSGMEPVNVRDNLFSATATTEIELGVNLPSTATEAGASGSSFRAPIEYFDNLGAPKLLTVEFSPSVPPTGASNTWNLSFFDSASATPTTSIASFDVTFDDTAANPGTIIANGVQNEVGGTYDDTTGLFSLNVESGPIDINIGLEDGTSSLTQIASDFSPIGIDKNGVAVGNLTDVEINQEGVLEAVYDNGFRQPIFQVPVGDVPNRNGLSAEDGQAYSLSQASGSVFFYDAGTGPVGTTIGFALEGSTTDVAAELTDLIETQRAYSSNARIIQTVDEMLEETTNLKR